MERRFPRAFGALEGIFSFVDEFFDREGIDANHRFAVGFAIEEIFTNIVKYGAPGEREIAVGLARVGDEVRIEIVDFDADDFDPTAIRDVDVDAPLDERRVGGLGLHLTRRIVDAMTYEYADRRSTVRMTKQLR